MYLKDSVEQKCTELAKSQNWGLTLFQTQELDINGKNCSKLKGSIFTAKTVVVLPISVTMYPHICIHASALRRPCKTHILEKNQITGVWPSSKLEDLRVTAKTAMLVSPIYRWSPLSRSQKANTGCRAIQTNSKGEYLWSFWYVICILHTFTWLLD